MNKPDSPAPSSRAPAVDPATIDFLRWIAERSATYGEALEMWQTTCPRQSTWEDSFIAGFVRSEARSGAAQPVVVLTPLGRSIIDGAAERGGERWPS